MAEYRYLVADLLTDTIREEMPFENVSFGDVLNAPGSFSGTLPLSVKDRTGFEKVTRANLDPGRTALYVERDGVLVWGGIIWTASADEGNFTLTIGAEGFWSYFRHRLIRNTHAYTATDQLAIVQDLVTYAQSAHSGDIGVVVGTDTSGVTRDRRYNSFERVNLGQAVEDLAALDGGFDFAIDVAYVSGVRTKSLRLSYPKRGSRLAHVLDLGTNIEQLSWTIDATKQANMIEALGAGEGSSMLIATSVDTSLLGSYPLLEDTISYKDVSVSATLHAHSQATMKARRRPVESLPTLVAHGTTDLVIGSFQTGDEIEARTTSAGGFLDIDTIFRILSWTVSVDDDGKETISFGLASTEALS